MALKGLDIEPGAMERVYGLGQELKNLGFVDSDWTSLGTREGRNGITAFKSIRVTPM